MCERESNNKTKTNERRERCIELAAMFKEKRKGTMKTLETILSKFSLQEGIRMVLVNEYFENLKGSGLIVFTSGKKGWRYHSEAEWDLFKVTIG
jgi:hypothetical protein